MKYIPSIAFEEMSGSAKGVTAAKVKSRKYIRNRGPDQGQGRFQASHHHVEGADERPDPCLEQTRPEPGGLSVLGTKGKISGANRAHSKAAAIKMVEEPTAAAIDIRADYVAKNGAPSAAAPKIIFRYYYVNSSTGEKSGVMLADVTWTAGE